MEFFKTTLSEPQVEYRIKEKHNSFFCKGESNQNYCFFTSDKLTTLSTLCLPNWLPSCSCLSTRGGKQWQPVGCGILCWWCCLYWWWGRWSDWWFVVGGILGADVGGSVVSAGVVVGIVVI